MSQWTAIEATVWMAPALSRDRGLANEPTYRGSESPHNGKPFSHLEKGLWYLRDDLRDVDDDDASEVRDWFLSLCKKYAPVTAELEIHNSAARYFLRWSPKDQNLQLRIPTLFKEWASLMEASDDNAQ